MPGNDASTAPIRDDGPPIPSDEVRRFLQHEPPDSETRDIPLLREQTRAAGLAVRGALEPVAFVMDRPTAGIPTRVYTPRSREKDDNTGFIWVHGGGWMHGDLDVYDGVCRAFCNALGCPVISVDYRLAPEHPFPGPLDDVWGVVLWATNEFDDVVVAGDSSGANLVAAAALRARDEGVRLAAQLLVYPMLESAATPFKQRFRTRYTPFVAHPRFGESTFDRIRWIWEEYVPDPADRENPLASPAHAASLAGLPPTVILTAEHDILRGEAEDYAERLRADGVPVELLEFAGQIHGFLQMRGVFTDAPRALIRAAAAVQWMAAQNSPARITEPRNADQDPQPRTTRN